MPSSVVNAPRSTLHTQNFDPVRVNSAEPSDLESGTSSESKTSCSSSNCSSNEQLDQPDHDRPKGSAEHRLSNGPMRSHSISPTNSTDRFVGVRSGGGSLDRRSSRPFALHHNPLPASSTNERRAVATGPNVGSGLRHCVSSASANMPPLCSTSHAWRTASNRSSLSSNSSGVYRDRPQSVHHIERPSFPPPDAPIRSTNESNAKSTESINSNGNSSASEDPQSHVQSSKGLFTTFSANRLDQPLLNESNHRVNFSTFKPQPEVRAHRTNSSSPSHRVTTLTTTITGNGSLSIDSYERKAPELPVKPPELLQRLQESASARQQANESVSNENINEPIGSNKVPPEIPARPTDIPTRFAPEKPPRSSTTHTTQSNATFNDISTGSLVSCIEIDGKSVEKDRDSYDSNTSERIRPPRPQPPNYKPRLTTEHTHL